MDFIPQMEPWFDEKEAQTVYDYMRSGGWVTEFSKTREFEEQIAKFTGAKYCSVVNNGTISLALALIACDIGPGDEVIVPDYTMVASANAVKLAGAEVVFVDICSENLCMDFDCMREAVSPRTKAVVLVTINGRYPQNLPDFTDFCQKNKLRLIEDAAQSLGSFKDGRHLGTFGDIGSLSFSPMKVITTGQGGALITNEEALIERIRKLRDFGRAQGGSDHYLTMGWNFKFTDLQAIIGLEQMKKLPWRVQRKKEIYTLYYKHLKSIAGISLIPTHLEDTSPWFIDILIENNRRQELMNYLKEKGIGTRPFYPALHAEPVYARAGNYPIAERIAKQGSWLPSSSKLTDAQIEYVCAQIRAFFDH
jgi:perosamine synthetase